MKMMNWDIIRLRLSSDNPRLITFQQNQEHSINQLSSSSHFQTQTCKNSFHNKLFYFQYFVYFLFLFLFLSGCFLQCAKCNSKVHCVHHQEQAKRTQNYNQNYFHFLTNKRNVTVNNNLVLKPKVSNNNDNNLLIINNHNSHNKNNNSTNNSGSGNNYFISSANQSYYHQRNHPVRSRNNIAINSIAPSRSYQIQSSNHKLLKLFSSVNNNEKSVNNLRNSHLLTKHLNTSPDHQHHHQNYKTTKRKFSIQTVKTDVYFNENNIKQNKKWNKFSDNLTEYYLVSFETSVPPPSFPARRPMISNGLYQSSDNNSLRHNRNKRQKESFHPKRQKVRREVETATESVMSEKFNEMVYNWIKNLECRTEWGFKMPYILYRLDTCARCYHYMPETAFKAGQKFSYAQYGILTHAGFNITLPSTDTERLSLTFTTTALMLKWQQCCADSIRCCLNYHYRHGIQSKLPNQNNADLSEYSAQSKPISTPGIQSKNDFTKTQEMCPPTWDGWLCWDEFAKPNQMLERPCPKHIYWHHLEPPCGGYVTKMCNSSGHWFVSQDNKEWSNYTMCARDDIYARRVQYSLVTNVISMCALIPALFIFSHYKQLASMARIRLHKHLFTSLLFHSTIAALLKWQLLQSTFARASNSESPSAFNHELPVTTFSESTSDSSLPQMPSLCLVLSVLLRYFRSTNYLWMFNEALYLHQLIKHAFSQPSLRPLIILAYVLPFITTTAYIFARFFSVTSDLATVNESLNTSLLNFTAPNNYFQFSPAQEMSFKDELVLSKISEYNKLVDDFRSSFIQLPDFQKQMLEANERQTKDRRHAVIKSSLDDLLDNSHNDANLIKNSFVVTDSPTLLRSATTTASVSHKSPPPSSSISSSSGTITNSINDDDNAGQQVLENLEALEDITPLTDNCWLMPSFDAWHEWIINVPNFAILIINCFFLVWLLRILCIKAAATMGTNNSPNHGGGYGSTDASAQATPQSGQHRYLNGSQRRSITTRHHHSSHHGGVFNRQSILVSLRAAVLLLPLYGLHYLFIVYRPKIENCWISEMYHYLSLSLDGLQGLAISIIFCFANSEIRHLLTRTLQRVGTRQRSTTIYMTEVAPTNH